MTQLVKRQLLYLLKFCVGATLVVWILMQVDREKFVQYFLKLNFFTIALIFILTVISLFIQLQRWKYLVKSNSINVNSTDLIPSFFAGFAFRLMVPGGHAEISKIFLLSGKKKGKVLAFGMEKFFQTYIKIFLILMMLPITFPQYKIYCILAIIVLILVYLFFPRLPILKNLQERKVQNHLLFTNVLIISLAIFSIMAVQYYILLNQVNSISLLDTFHTVIYLWGAGIIPISISGLGIREGLAVYFLKIYGIPAAYAVATSLFLFTLNTIFPALVGIYYIYMKRNYLKEMKDSVRSTRELIHNLRNHK